MAQLRSLAALGLLLLATSCSTSSPTAAPAPRSTALPPSSAAPAPVADPAKDAKAQAAALVPRYLQTIDGLYADPARSLDDLYEVAAAPEATAEATAIGMFRSQGYRQTGQSQLVTTSATTVDLTNDPAATPSPVFPSVIVTACVDVSHVQATYPSGNSVIAPDRPKYLIEQLTIVNINYPDASSWRVREAPNRQAQACDG